MCSLSYSFSLMCIKKYLYQCTCISRWGSRGGFPLIFRPNWGPKGREIFFQDHPPHPLFISGSGWPLPPTSPLSPLSEGLDPPLQVYHILFLISSVVFSLQGWSRWRNWRRWQLSWSRWNETTVSDECK